MQIFKKPSMLTEAYLLITKIHRNSKLKYSAFSDEEKIIIDRFIAMGIAARFGQLVILTGLGQEDAIDIAKKPVFNLAINLN